MDGSDTSFSSCRRVFKTRKRYLRGYKTVVAKQFIRSVSDQVVSSIRNQQTPFRLTAYTSSLGTSSPTVCGGDDLQDVASILNLEDPAPGDVNLNRQRKFKVNDITCRYRIKNQSQLTVKLTLYDITPRRDGSTAGDPLGDWKAGIDFAQQGTGVTDIDYAMPGSTPYQSPFFCQTWKILKRVTMNLHAGSEHLHTVHVRPGGMLQQQLITNYETLHGLSVQTLMVVEGGLGTDSAATAEAGLHAADLVIMAQYNCNFMCLERSRPTTTQYYGLTVAPTGSVEAILEDADAPVKAVNANAAP